MTPVFKADSQPCEEFQSKTLRRSIVANSCIVTPKLRGIIDSDEDCCRI
jgi:hypothetical protein